MDSARTDMIARIVHAVCDGPVSRAKVVTRAWSSRGWVPEWAVEQYPNIGWNWDALSSNSEAMSLSFVAKTAQTLPWRWECVSARPDVDSRSIADHPSIPWNAAVLHLNDIVCDHVNCDPFTSRVMNVDDMVNYVHKQAKMRTINPDLVRRNMHLPFNYRLLSDCSLLHDLAIEFPDLGWDWTVVAIYAHVDRFVDHPDLFDPEFLITGRHISPHGSRRICAAVAIQCAYRCWRARRFAACLRIQRAWTKARYDPDHAMCRARLTTFASVWGMEVPSPATATCGTKRAREQEISSSAPSDRSPTRHKVSRSGQKTGRKTSCGDRALDLHVLEKDAVVGGPNTRPMVD